MPKNNYTKTNKGKTNKGVGRTNNKVIKKGKTKPTGANNYTPGGVDSYDEIKSNDIGWYDKAGYLFNEATRVPFDVIAGAPYVYAGSHTSIDGRNQQYLPWEERVDVVSGEAIPGIMTIKYKPFIGYSDSINSPINRAFTTMFGDLQSKTTGVLPFQQADLAMFVTSTSCIAGLLGHVKKIMEIATLYTPLNYYYPVDLLTSILGDDYNALEVIRNRDLYRSKINNLIFQFNSLKIPSFVDVFKRQYSIAHNIFADEDDVQAQLYVFIPTARYKYFDTDGTIKMVPLTSGESSGSISLNELIQAIQNCLDQWRNSSDLPLINGALLRAYPDNEFVKIDMLNVDSVLTPVYDRNILWQINNSRSVKLVEGTLDVKQDVVHNFLICKPQVDISNNPDMEYRSWVYLNSYDFNESPEFIMEATRLLPYIDFEIERTAGEPDKAILNTAVTELIEDYTIWTRLEFGGGVNELVKYTFDSNIVYNPLNVTILSMLSKWRNAPRITMWDQVPNGEEYDSVYLGEFGDLAHYTRLNQGQLASLHEAALQSLYWIDSMNLRV